MAEDPPGKAVIYVRISQDREGAGLGVERQEIDCRALAERLGFVVVAVHRDNDISAYSGKPRPGYRALLADLESGRASVVITWHTDRLHRRPVELEEYIAVCELHGVVTHTVQAGELDLATPSGRMVARMLGSSARYESEHKGARVRAARRQAAAAGGRWQGGQRPFGFEPDGETIRPVEADEIRAATDALLAGASIRSIVLGMNARGIGLPKTGGTWSTVRLRHVLMRPRNAGLAVYRGEVVGPARWEPIVPEDRWRALVALLRDPSRQTSTSGRVRWLGSGLYVCGVCGKPSIRVGTGGVGGRAYRCNSGLYVARTPGHVTRKASALDGYVEATIIERLRRADAVELLRPASAGVDTRGLHGEAVALRQRLEQLGEAFAEGAVTMMQLRAGTDRIRGRLKQVEADIAAAASGDPLADLVGAADIGAVWAGLDIGRRRSVLDVLATVTVLPSDGTRGPDGNTFNPAFVRIEPKV